VEHCPAQILVVVADTQLSGSGRSLAGDKLRAGVEKVSAPTVVGCGSTTSEPSDNTPVYGKV